jgi:hypothetical protein
LKRGVSRAFQRFKLESPREEGVEERSPTTDPWSPFLVDLDLVDVFWWKRERREVEGEGRLKKESG